MVCSCQGQGKASSPVASGRGPPPAPCLLLPPMGATAVALILCRLVPSGPMLASWPVLLLSPVAPKVIPLVSLAGSVPSSERTKGVWK